MKQEKYLTHNKPLLSMEELDTDCISCSKHCCIWGSDYEPVLTQGVAVHGNLGQFGISLRVNSVLLVSSRQVSVLQKPPCHLEVTAPLVGSAAEHTKGANVQVITLAPSRLGLGNVCGAVSARTDRALAGIKISYTRLLSLELSFWPLSRILK